MKLNKLYMLTLTSKSTSEGFIHISTFLQIPLPCIFFDILLQWVKDLGPDQSGLTHICIMVISLGKGEICFRISIWASLKRIIKRKKECWENVRIVLIIEGNIPGKVITLESLRYQNQGLDDSGLALSASVFCFFWLSASFIPVLLTTSYVRGFSYQQSGHRHLCLS